VSADLAERSASFQEEGGGKEPKRSYDLLVAADGCWSRVGRCCR
jgi:2-polyprenyl-6-methoxyphenol hydroxylase-like FAD-dependent oxidoreductase